jgi:glutathione reductase (NADPH)
MDRHPTIGTVGLTEAQAREKYGDAVKICKFTFSSPLLLPDASRDWHITIDKSKFRALYFSMLDEEHKEPSMYKLIVVGPEERVVGIHIVGMGSDEVMQGFGVAVKMGGALEFFVFLFFLWMLTIS